MSARFELLQPEGPQAVSDFLRLDALGLVHVEDQIADWFWPGFTSRTTQIAYFPVVAYGVWVAEEAARRHGLRPSDDAIRAMFQSWERLWAMMLCAHFRGVLPAEERFRGAERAIRAYATRRKGRLPLDYPLLNRQRELGALGAHLSALRRHRLIAQRRLRVTPLGWEMARWLWGRPETATESIDEAIIEALHPRRESIGERVGSVALAALGERARLGALADRPELRDYLWSRLFVPTASCEDLSALPIMVQVLIHLGKDAVRDPLSLLRHIQRPTLPVRIPPFLRQGARLAQALVEVGRSLLDVFGRMHDFVRSQGYEATWADCVQYSVIPEVVDALGDRLRLWRELEGQQPIANLSVGARVFSLALSRINPQNSYNLFESVLALHTSIQRILGTSGAWIERSGEAVLMQQTHWAHAADRFRGWTPTFRTPVVVGLLEQVQRL